jgi:hypothetical protein
MIDIASLTEPDRGRWVRYRGKQKGRIKDWNFELIRQSQP